MNKATNNHVLLIVPKNSIHERKQKQKGMRPEGTSLVIKLELTKSRLSVIVELAKPPRQIIYHRVMTGSQGYSDRIGI